MSTKPDHKKMVCVIGTKLDFLNFFLEFPKEDITLWNKSYYRFETNEKIFQWFSKPDRLRGIHNAEVRWATPFYLLDNGEELQEMALRVQLP